MLHDNSLAKLPTERFDLKLKTESFLVSVKDLHLGPDPNWICTILDGLCSHLLLPSLQFLVQDPASPRKFQQNKTQVPSVPYVQRLKNHPISLVNDAVCHVCDCMCIYIYNIIYLCVCCIYDTLVKPTYHSQVGGLRHQTQAATASDFYRSASATCKGGNAKMSSSQLEIQSSYKG